MDTGSSGKKFSSINITPMVDVMLVLLVIFMITAPLMLNGIKLKLPKTKEVNRMNISNSQTILSITKTEDYYLGKNKVKRLDLLRELKNTFDASKEILYLRADFSLSYGKVANIMSYLKKGGVTNIALVTEITDEK